MSLKEELQKRLISYREHPRRLEMPKQASVSLIIRETIQNGLQILFIKRVLHPHDPWSGHMAFPGGHLELNFETPLEGALRETHEEIGLQLNDHEFVGVLDDFQVHFRGVPSDFIIFPHVFYLRSENEITLNPHQNEVADTFWIDFSFFNEEKNLMPLKYQFQGNEIDLPSFYFNQDHIWGISYLILMDLFKKLEGLKLPQNIGNLEIRSSHWIHYPHYSKSYK